MAAGNCVILKPSEIAPHTAAAIGNMIRATFPPEYVTLLEGGPEIVKGLIEGKLDMIFFTGSLRAGVSVMASAAARPTPIVLELGGKCPCVVCGDAPVEVTARRIVWGKFLNAGQTCVAPDYVLVDRRIRDDLIDAMKRALVEFYGVDPRQSAEYGRIINQRHFDRLLGYLPSGRLHVGGDHDAVDRFIAPTIITDVSADAPVLHDEIFGPILPVCAFDDLKDALSLIADRPTPLASYLFTHDRSIQERFLAETRSGGVCINDVVSHMVGTGLPFGGLGESGFGAYHGKAGFDCFSHRRVVLRRWFKPDLRLRYPPPKVSLKTTKRAFRYLMGG
jgi:aldehyde dehydrogenase (NAD+)